MTPLRTIKRLSVALIGGTVLLVGLALIVLPGPALIVIPAGLAILGLEFAWARRWLRKAQGLLRKQANPDAASRAGLQALGSMKDRFIQFATGAVCIARSVLLVLAGVVVVAISLGLALLLLAFAETRRAVGNVCARLLGRNPLPSKRCGRSTPLNWGRCRMMLSSVTGSVNRMSASRPRMCGRLPLSSTQGNAAKRWPFMGGSIQ
jgi:hypothetical protein